MTPYPIVGLTCLCSFCFGFICGNDMAGNRSEPIMSSSTTASDSSYMYDGKKHRSVGSIPGHDTKCP